MTSYLGWKYDGVLYPGRYTIRRQLSLRRKARSVEGIARRIERKNNNQKIKTMLLKVSQNKPDELSFSNQASFLRINSPAVTRLGEKR